MSSSTLVTATRQVTTYRHIYGPDVETRNFRTRLRQQLRSSRHLRHIEYQPFGQCHDSATHWPNAGWHVLCSTQWFQDGSLKACASEQERRSSKEQARRNQSPRQQRESRLRRVYPIATHYLAELEMVDGVTHGTEKRSEIYRW